MTIFKGDAPEFIVEAQISVSKRSDGRYPMCKNQDAQIDCRKTECKYHECGSCKNISPAITLNENGKFTCWSEVSK